LNQTGVVRSDIRSSFAGLTGTADGIPLTIALTIVSATTCDPLAAQAVYIWHCDRLGRYSLYSAGVTNQNYLRGVQAADAAGRITFQSIFPGWYAGRWPHIHFEVSPTLSGATSVANWIATSTKGHVLAREPGVLKLALEMAAHEESERRALEGELAVLERSWKEAEEIAAISDNLTYTDRIERALQSLKQRAGG
jgi:protocatechuate 3,4-dioxygenase beta subunit